MVAAQAGLELRTMARNGEQLLLVVIIPVLLLAAFSREPLISFGPGRRIDFLAPGILALAVMSTAFTSQAIATGFERRYGVLKRLGASPLPRSGLLLGKVLALLLVEVLQLVIVGGVGLALGWAPSVSVLGAVATFVLGTFAFAALGLLVAGVLRAEATLAAANLIYLLLLAGGAVVIPATSYGSFGDVARYLPSGALGGSMRFALLDHGVDATGLLTLLGLGLLGTALTAKTFRWE